jgi:hypothetical protein
MIKIDFVSYHDIYSEWSLFSLADHIIMILMHILLHLLHNSSIIANYVNR